LLWTHIQLRFPAAHFLEAQLRMNVKWGGAAERMVGVVLKWIARLTIRQLVGV
jgi:hypothetical protein